MEDFWLAETDFLVPVELTIERRNRWLGKLKTGQDWDDEEKQTVSHVRWKQSNGIHEISYQEAPQAMAPSEEGEAPAESASSTVCRLEPGVLTWQRFGGVQWEHVFEMGDTHSSTMAVPGAGTIEVQLATKSISIEVNPDGGSIHVTYDMTISDVTQYVELSMEFKRIE